MNAKQSKYLALFETLCLSKPIDADTVMKHLSPILNLDAGLAVDTWEYLCATREQKIAASDALATYMGVDALDLYYRKLGNKTVKTLVDIPVLRRVVYQYAPFAVGGVAFTILIDAMLAGKADIAEEFFKCLVRNERVTYGAAMKALLERLFIEILKKNPAKRIEMPRKLATMLLTYIAKIKTDERPMLEQRVRETL